METDLTESETSMFEKIRRWWSRMMTMMIKSTGTTMIILILFVGCYFAIRFVNVPTNLSDTMGKYVLPISSSPPLQPPPSPPLPLSPPPYTPPSQPLPLPPPTTPPKSQSPDIIQYEFPLHCLPPNTTQTCPKPPTNFNNQAISSNLPNSKTNISTCPDYFRWIHEDLRPWKTADGISRQTLESAKPHASIRLVIVNGRAYVEKYKGVYQTRDVFTIWGILQVLRLYPGKLPDLDIMFECNDTPVIMKSDFVGNLSCAPPLFGYCGDDESLDIAFPDWSFWGWPEINIKPWGSLTKEMIQGNQRVKWEDRAPYAYWKGNLHMGSRMSLLRCNSTEQWNTQIYWQRWALETKRGFRTSNLADQCIHRYKIYMEGVAWSASEKYIQACDSMLLFINARYYEFFTRSLIPLKHYWPVDRRNLCNSIKDAVDWGNKNPAKAKEIGRSGSNFILEELKMKYVYDYMFHLLNEYGKLLSYKPTIPPRAVEVCAETMVCNVQSREKMFKEETLIRSPSTTSACVMPPPFDVHDIQTFIDMQRNIRHNRQG